MPSRYKGSAHLVAEVARLRTRIALARQVAALVDTGEDAILGLGLDGSIRNWSAGATRLYGYPRPAVLGRAATLLLPAERADELWQILARVRRGERVDRHETVHLRQDGSTVAVAFTAAPIRDGRGQISGVSALTHDISAQKRVEDALAHLALHDPLTGLPNRTLLHERLELALRTMHRANATLALLIMDLDRFKEINDTLGHPVGDELLRQVACRLQGTIRQVDTVARLGGDEFAIVLPAAEGRAAGRIARRLLQVMEAPVLLEGHALDVPLSIGIALYPEHGADAATIMRRADVAMYQAKRTGSGYAVYTAAEDPYSPERLTLISELRQAIARDELVLFYQPQISHATGCITTVEALVRWQHPEQGLLDPAAFLPLAEHTGLIQPLSHWVLNAALHQTAIWREHGWDLPVAVNVSMEDLRDAYLPATIQRLLENWEVRPQQLCVEITENAAMRDPARTLGVLTALRRIGVQVAIDDFGIGYSSLAQLKRLPVDQIKIDKSFVRDLTQNTHDAAIVHAIIELGHSMGLRVVAEGVRDHATWEHLTRLGCDESQGFYLSRPLSPPELAERWDTQGWRAS